MSCNLLYVILPNDLQWSHGPLTGLSKRQMNNPILPQAQPLETP